LFDRQVGVGDQGADLYDAVLGGQHFLDGSKRLMDRPVGEGRDQNTLTTREALGHDIRQHLRLPRARRSLHQRAPLRSRPGGDRIALTFIVASLIGRRPCCVECLLIDRIFFRVSRCRCASNSVNAMASRFVATRRQSRRWSDSVGSGATPVTSTVRPTRIPSAHAAAVFEFLESEWIVSMPRKIRNDPVGCHLSSSSLLSRSR
jgi:hypothetical protein